MKHLHLALLGLAACGTTPPDAPGEDGPCNGGPMLQSFADRDYDGYGDATDMVEDCVIPEGYTDNADDCDDASDATHPGADELCDGIDNDCDEQADEDLLSEWTMADTASTQTVVRNADGLVVQTITSWEEDGVPMMEASTFGYDAGGRLIEQEDDTDGDGIADRRAEWTHDAQGRVTREAWDDDLDGSVDRVTAQTWSASGELTSRTVREGGDVVSSEAWTHDADGRILTWSRDADGEVVVITYEYTDDGLLTYQGTDADGDGFDEVWIDQTWNADGTLDRIADYRHDGTFRTDHFYDDEGRLIRVEKDDYYDLLIDETIHHLWSEDGLQLTIRVEDANGAVLWQRHEVHDEDGRVTSEQYDDDGDDVYETAMYRSWDVDGNPTMVAWDDDGDGTIDRMTLSTWDAEGRRTSLGEDADGDGVPEVQSRWSYDAQGRLATTEHDRDGDGVFEESYAAELACIESV